MHKHLLDTPPWLICIVLLFFGLLASIRPSLRRWRAPIVVLGGWLLAIGFARLLAIGFARHFDCDYLLWDLRVFWRAGAVIGSGGNPYEPDAHEWRPLNPPNSLIFMRLLASRPFDEVAPLAYLLNIALAVILGVLIALVLRGRGDRAGPETGGLDLGDTALLCLILASSFCVRICVYAGQFSIWSACFIYLGLYLDQRGRPGLAGLCLALATPKVGTVIPFLLLFARRDAWKFWLVFASTNLGMVLCLYSPGEIAGIIRKWLDAVAYYSTGGRVNDYSANTADVLSMVSVDYWLWKLGVLDKELVKWLQLAILGGWGLLVAWAVVRRWPSRDPLVIAVVSVYSCLFLYHRVYDLIMLGFALFYYFHRAGAFRSTDGRWGRLRAACGAVVATIAMNFPNSLLSAAFSRSRDGSLTSHLLQIGVLPARVWLAMVLALLLLVEVSRQGPRLDEAGRTLVQGGAGLRASLLQTGILRRRRGRS